MIIKFYMKPYSIFFTAKRYLLSEYALYKNSTTVFAYYFNTLDYHTYWQEYIVNFIIPVECCMLL